MSRKIEKVGWRCTPDDDETLVFVLAKDRSEAISKARRALDEEGAEDPWEWADWKCRREKSMDGRSRVTYRDVHAIGILEIECRGCGALIGEGDDAVWHGDWTATCSPTCLYRTESPPPPGANYGICVYMNI